MNRTSASGRPYCVTISASSLSSFASVVSSRVNFSARSKLSMMGQKALFT